MSRIVSIGDVAEVVRGVTYQRESAISGPREGYIPVLRAGNIQDQLVLDEDLVWLPTTAVSNRQLLRPNDVLMCTSSGSADVVGKSAFFEAEGWVGSFGAFCAVIRANENECVPAYLKHVLRATAFLNWARASLGANIKNIRKSELELFQFQLPTRADQLRIAIILDKAEGLRRKRQDAILLADQFIQSLFFTTFGDVDTNTQDLEMCRLEDLALQVTDGEHQTPRRSADGIKLLSARNVQNGFLALTDVDYVPADEFERIRRRCEPKRGDILISCSGTIGRVASVATNEPMALVRSVALVRPDTRKVRTSFLEHYLRSASMQRRMAAASKSSAQANLFQGPIRSLPVLLPPMSLQADFERRLLSMQSWSRKATDSAELIGDLSKSLQNRYFSSGAVL